MTNSTFKDGDKVRIVSYIDPDVVLGITHPLPPVTTSHIHLAGTDLNLPIRPADTPVQVCRRSNGGNTDTTAWVVVRNGAKFSLYSAADRHFVLIVDSQGALQLTYRNPGILAAMADMFSPLELTTEAASKGDPWVYLREASGERRMDIDHGRTDQGTTVLLFKPNSGDNQIWRAELA